MFRIAIVAVVACSSSRPTAPATNPPADATAPVVIVVDAAVVALVPPPPPPQIEPDGNDDPEDPGTGLAPTMATWKKVGSPPLALTRICDLTPLGDALYLAHANSPLGSDGATITRYRPPFDPGPADAKPADAKPADAKPDAKPGRPAKPPNPFSVAFDWNRRGQPTRGGGAGQGFVRVHAIDGRLYVADADPPYNGLGIVEQGTEGYVFISDDHGTFAPPKPGARPPATAGVLPRAYHVLDVVKFRGALYASAGSVPPKERAWRGPSPGALHRANADGTRWLYEIDYPFPYLEGVWRLTYLVRFKDRLYAGIQDYDGREPNDFLIFAPPATPGPVTLAREHVKAVKVTANGAAGTLRWWVDTHATPPRLYWVAWSRGESVQLRATVDGDTWKPIALPSDAGMPTDITRFRDAIVVLTERGLWRLDPKTDQLSAIAKVDGKSPFELTDFFCAAPLAVFRNTLYAGGQRAGSLYQLDESSTP